MPTPLMVNTGGVNFGGRGGVGGSAPSFPDFFAGSETPRESASTGGCPPGMVPNPNDKAGWNTCIPGGSGGGGGGGGAGGGNLTNRVAPDPNLQTQVNRLQQRLSTDPTNRAIGRSFGAIADAAAARKSAKRVELASRGLAAEEGAGGQEMSKIDAAAQRAQAGAAADISLGRERDLDQLVLGGQGIMAAPGERELGYGNLGLEQYRTGRDFELQQRRLNLEAGNQRMAQWLALMRMYGAGAA